MTYDGPIWLNINIWQWSRHCAETGIIWSREMDHQVRRYMDGEIMLQTSALNCDSTAKRVEARAQVLMMEAMDVRRCDA